MLRGAVSSLLPPTNQCDTTSQNSENHNGTVAEPQVLRDYCFRAESQTAEDTKNYTNVKKYFSWPFSMWDLKFSQWIMIPVVCDVTGIIPIYHCTSYYIPEHWNTDHLPCFLFPFSEVHFTVVFTLYVWT